MRTAFVTGSTGFLGLNIVRELKAQGYRVLGLHRPATSTKHLVALGAEPIPGGIDERADLVRTIPKDVDVVFHVAADLSLWWGHDAQQKRVNVDGTANVVAAALERGAKRFVHTSSVAAFGIVHERLTERTPSRAADSRIGYVRTKWLGEEEVRRGVAQGLSAVIMNPANILGPYDSRSWSRVFRMMKEGKVPVMPPGIGSWCDSREVAKAHVRGVDVGRAGEQFLLGGSEVSYVEVMRIMAELLGVKAPPRAPGFVLMGVGAARSALSYLTRKEPEITLTNAFFVSSTLRVDASKAERELGFKQVPIRDMVVASYEWLKGEGLL